MSAPITRRVVEGRVHVSLAVVAETYEVELAWVEELHALGVLGRAVRVDDTLLVACSALERVAAVRRLQIQQGVDLAAAVALLELIET